MNNNKLISQLVITPNKTHIIDRPAGRRKPHAKGTGKSAHAVKGDNVLFG